MEYFAKITKDPESADFVVSFPDMPNVNTFGFNFEHAKEMAAEALNGVLEADFERGYDAPPPRNFAGRRNMHPIVVEPHIALSYEMRKLRKGQTQGELASKLGISYQAYQKLENPRKCNPTIKTLEKIGAALGKRLVVTFR
jgi:antitoxin HicB